MSGSFGDLLKQAGLQGSGRVEEPDEAVAAQAPTGPTFAPKVVVRRTKAGRGGKTVTLVQGVTGGLKQVAKALRKQLGTGARVEGDDVVVQGDQRDRIGAWLEAQGVKQVVLS